jgi:hypothetical protein
MDLTIRDEAWPVRISKFYFMHITRMKHTMTLTLIFLMTLDGDVAMDMQRSVKKATFLLIYKLAHVLLL